MAATPSPHYWPFAWRMAFRASSPWFGIISGAIFLLMMIIPDLRGRGVEVALPLIAGIQAALLFSPDDEPALEMQLAAPRPVSYILYERLAAVLIAQGIVGVIGTILISAITGVTPLVVVIGWLPPTIAAVGLGLLGTFISRRSSAGVLAVILVIPSMFLGADLLIMRFPELFPLHFFFQPMFAAIGAGYFNAVPELLYAINRIAITLLGVLAMLRLIFGMRNAESLLGVNRKSD
ncbi:MAG: hypothetical protein IAE89_06990 [Anaerolineae bacterium]|nr:hypothetical protein [Anaerolineae bacterium]